MESRNLFNVRLDDVSEEELERLLHKWIVQDEQRFIVTPNPEMMLVARKDFYFKNILNSSDLSLPDGIGLRFAIAALNDVVIRRHTGTDTLDRLARICAENGRKLFLLGGELPRVAERTAETLRGKYSGLKVVGYDPGYIDVEKGRVQISGAVRDKVHTFQPDVLAVALGQRKQEMFMYQLLPQFPSVKIAIGVGGAFDMISGSIRRAPEIMRKTGLEWIWRLYLEPKRIKRIYRASVIFPLVVVWGTLRKRRFIRAVKRVFPLIFRQLTGRTSL